MDFDVIVVGAGPSGLCFAQALADTRLRIALIEPQPETELRDAPFDGREIALTHFSARALQSLGVWAHIPGEAISALRDAKVINGVALNGMLIEHRHGNKDELGYLVSNHLIRRAAYAAVKASPNATLLCGVKVTDVSTNVDAGAVTLSDGRTLHAPLIIAADSRFSATRRAMGIPAHMHDFGKVMLVCCMEHDVPHEHVAWEWFDYGQTLALLPMNGNRSSVVLTLPQHEMQAVQAMPEAEFNVAMQKRFADRLGAMRLVSTRHAYPLVTVYADRFVARRFALMGDAAVGMHPVTAHGFNFGLRAADTLANGIKRALAIGSDFAAPSVLSAYERTHRLATLPLFAATHAVAKIYTNESMPARLLRDGLLAIGERVTPFKRLIAASLTGAR